MSRVHFLDGFRGGLASALRVVLTVAAVLVTLAVVTSLCLAMVALQNGPPSFWPLFWFFTMFASAIFVGLACVFVIHIIWEER